MSTTLDYIYLLPTNKYSISQLDPYNKEIYISNLLSDIPNEEFNFDIALENFDYKDIYQKIISSIRRLFNLIYEKLIDIYHFFSDYLSDRKALTYSKSNIIEYKNPLENILKEVKQTLSQEEQDLIDIKDIEKLITLLKDYDNSIYNYLHKFTYRDVEIKSKETSFLRNMLEENIIRFDGSNDILQFLKTGSNDNKITNKTTTYEVINTILKKYNGITLDQVNIDNLDDFLNNSNKYLKEEVKTTCRTFGKQIQEYKDKYSEKTIQRTLEKTFNIYSDGRIDFYYVLNNVFYGYKILTNLITNYTTKLARIIRSTLKYLNGKFCTYSDNQIIFHHIPSVEKFLKGIEPKGNIEGYKYYLLEDALKRIRELSNGAIDPSRNDSYRCATVQEGSIQPFILIGSNIYNLDYDIRNFILYHEYGHIVCEHIFLNYKNMYKRVLAGKEVLGNLYSLEQELEADQIAVNKFGKNVCIKALEKTLSFPGVKKLNVQSRLDYWKNN